MLCRNEFSSRLQKRRLFLCFRMLFRFWFSTVCLLMCEEHHLYCVFQGGISGLRYSRCRNGFRWLHQRECKRSGSWTLEKILNKQILRVCCLNLYYIKLAEARLHLLCRLRRGSLPRCRLRTSPRQAGSLVNPFAAQLACRGEIKNADWWMLCRNGFSSRLQKRRLFLCFRMLLRFWFSTVWI